MSVKSLYENNYLAAIAMEEHDAEACSLLPEASCLSCKQSYIRQAHEAAVPMSMRKKPKPVVSDAASMLRYLEGLSPQGRMEVAKALMQVLAPELAILLATIEAKRSEV